MKKLTSTKILAPSKPRCKLSRESVIELINMHHAGWSYTQLAKHFAVSKNFVWYTIKGEKDNNEKTEVCT